MKKYIQKADMQELNAKEVCFSQLERMGVTPRGLAAMEGLCVYSVRDGYAVEDCGDYFVVDTEEELLEELDALGEAYGYNADGNQKTTYRDLAEEDESMNLGWCKPYVSADGSHVLILHDGEVESIFSPAVRAYRWNGSLTDEVMAAFAREVNPYYDDYQGWTDLHIALEAMQETGCWHCPWRDDCDAMGEEVKA